MTKVTTKEAIRDLLDDGLSLEDIAYLHGMTDIEGLREVMGRD